MKWNSIEEEVSQCLDHNWCKEVTAVDIRYFLLFFKRWRVLLQHQPHRQTHYRNISWGKAMSDQVIESMVPCWPTWGCFTNNCEADGHRLVSHNDNDVEHIGRGQVYNSHCLIVQVKSTRGDRQCKLCWQETARNDAWLCAEVIGASYQQPHQGCPKMVVLCLAHCKI